MTEREQANESLNVRLNKVGVLADFIRANKNWTTLAPEHVNVREAETIFIDATCEHEFFLEPSNWMETLESTELKLGGDGTEIINIVKISEAFMWIGILNAIIRSERFNSGTIRHCIANGSLQAVLNVFEYGEHHAIFPEEVDFTQDSREDVLLRKHGANPMSEGYVNQVNERRIALGVVPYMPKSESPQRHIDLQDDITLLTSNQYMKKHGKK